MCILYAGLAKGGFSTLSRGASYSLMRLIPEYIRYIKTKLTYHINQIIPFVEHSSCMHRFLCARIFGLFISLIHIIT